MFELTRIGWPWPALERHRLGAEPERRPCPASAVSRPASRRRGFRHEASGTPALSFSAAVSRVNEGNDGANGFGVKHRQEIAELAGQLGKERLPSGEAGKLGLGLFHLGGQGRLAAQQCTNEVAGHSRRPRSRAASSRSCSSQPDWTARPCQSSRKPIARARIGPGGRAQLVDQAIQRRIEVVRFRDQGRRIAWSKQRFNSRPAMSGYWLRIRLRGRSSSEESSSSARSRGRIARPYQRVPSILLGGFISAGWLPGSAPMPPPRALPSSGPKLAAVRRMMRQQVGRGGQDAVTEHEPTQ